MSAIPHLNKSKTRFKTAPKTKDTLIQDGKLRKSVEIKWKEL